MIPAFSTASSGFDVGPLSGQKTKELREAAQGKTQELKGAVESAWSDTKSQASNWQAEGGSLRVRQSDQGYLHGVGFGFLLGLLLLWRYVGVIYFSTEFVVKVGPAISSNFPA